MTDNGLKQCSFSVIRGNLAEEPVDAIGLGVGSDYFPNGPAAGAIFGSAGDRLQNELAGREADSPGDITKTACFDLPADHIYLCALQDGQDTDDLEIFLTNCYHALLTHASDDESIRSLALPPLGTGDFGYSLEIASKTLVRCLKDLDQQEFDLESVKMVVYEAVQFHSVENFVEKAKHATDEEDELRTEYF